MMMIITIIVIVGMRAGGDGARALQGGCRYGQGDQQR